MARFSYYAVPDFQRFSLGFKIGWVDQNEVALHEEVFEVAVNLVCFSLGVYVAYGASQAQGI